jgi:hypothetical protein
MKSSRVRRSFLSLSVVAIVLSVGHAFAAPAKSPEKPAAPTTKAGAPAAPKKEEPEGKVEGIEVKRGAGYFGVALVGGTFKITFYDAKRHVVPAPFTRAALRWQVNYRPADERTVLNVDAEGKALVSAKIVKAPYVFKLFITFLADGADEAAGGESYVVDFRA